MIVGRLGGSWTPKKNRCRVTEGGMECGDIACGIAVGISAITLRDLGVPRYDFLWLLLRQLVDEWGFHLVTFYQGLPRLSPDQPKKDMDGLLIILAAGLAAE